MFNEIIFKLNRNYIMQVQHNIMLLERRISRGVKNMIEFYQKLSQIT